MHHGGGAFLDGVEGEHLVLCGVKKARLGCLTVKTPIMNHVHHRAFCLAADYGQTHAAFLDRTNIFGHCNHAVLSRCIWCACGLGVRYCFGIRSDEICRAVDRHLLVE